MDKKSNIDLAIKKVHTTVVDTVGMLGLEEE